MKVVESLALVLVVTFAGWGLAGPADAEASPGELAFSLGLYERLRDTEGNLCLSPIGLFSTLDMTLEGARGRTRTQMAEVLGVVEHQPLPDAIRTANGEGGPFFTANALWIQLGHELRDVYRSSIRERHDAGFGRLDFSGDTARARKAINDWTAERTDGKIDQLLVEGDLDSDTVLVLTNAVYFDGRWAVPFDEGRTVDAEFRLTSDRSVRVPFMQHTNELPLASLDQLALVELAYDGGRFAMLLLLPHDDDGLPRVEALLTSEHLAGWLDQLQPTPVRVRIPRFTIDSHLALEETLQSMGMTNAFTGRADFSGMSPEPGLFISSVVQSVRFEVDERGTEGAAGSGVAIKKGPHPAEFVADRPFLFLVRDRLTGHVLFIGRVSNPAS
jgi:serpin B